MPSTQPLRALAAACAVVATLLVAVPSPAAALEPPRPLPGYHPAFVTETDTHPWKDCLWASGSMLLDKWTNGQVTKSRQQLRALSGDHHGGSTFDDLKESFRKLGFHLVFSPDGGARITWPQLLRRLSAGAGAVLLGDDGDLPRYFGRWDSGFWNNTGKKDNHAVYIERYDRRRGRVWLMDPLGRGDWKGEWISVRALRKFAWSSGGALSVAVTPTAKAAPFARVRIGASSVTVTGATMRVSWDVKAPRAWRFPGVSVRTTFQPALDPLKAAAVSPPVTSLMTPAVAPARPATALVARALHLTAALPSKPGAWLATVTLRDRRFGRVVAQTGTVAVFVPGDRRATVTLHTSDTTAETGESIPITVSVTNTGILTWANATAPVGVPAPTVARNTHLVTRWVPIDVEPVAPASSDGATAATRITSSSATAPVAVRIPDPDDLRPLALGPRDFAQVHASVTAPSQPGTWALVVDVVDNVDGSFAAHGSAPATQVFQVAPARQKGLAQD